MSELKERYRKPHKLTETAWFYENPRSIIVVVECRKDGLYHQTQQIVIPKRALEKLELKQRNLLR